MPTVRRDDLAKFPKYRVVLSEKLGMSKPGYEFVRGDCEVSDEDAEKLVLLGPYRVISRDEEPLPKRRFQTLGMAVSPKQPPPPKVPELSPLEVNAPILTAPPVVTDPSPSPAPAPSVAKKPAKP